MKTSTRFSLAVLFIFAIGCEVSELDQPASSPGATPVETVVEEPVEEDNRLDMSAVPNEPPPTTATPREFTKKDAKKGKLNRQAGGYLGAVGNARFTAVHQMTINLYTQAMQLYRAEHGNYPKTHEEFMKEIIRKNKIRLPALEEGDEYIYDPADHILKIYRPGAKAPGEME